MNILSNEEHSNLSNFILNIDNDEKFSNIY